MSDEVLRTFREVTAELTGPGGPFALDEVMVRGRPLKVYAGTAGSLNDIYEAAVRAHGESDLIDYLDERRTLADVAADAEALGAALRARWGVGPGDRIGIMMRNRPEWFPAFMAVTRIGAVATLLNSRGAGDEVAAAANGVGCRLVIADEASCDRLRGTAIEAEVIDLEAMARLVAAGGPDRAPVRTDTDAAAVILFTSGTTGRPKGATLTHRNMAAMAENLRYIMRLGLTLAARRYGLPIETIAKAAPRSSALLIMPLFHISGLANFFTAWLSGGLLTLMRRWDVAEAVRLIEKNRVTALSGPSMVIADLLDHPGAEERIQSLGTVVVGGQATPVALAERVTKALPRSSQATGWGMTELSGQASGASGAMFAAFPGTCGVFNPLFEGRVVDGDDRPLPAGQPGELQVRGATVMAGYFNDPEATARSFVDGWFRSGDIAVIDEQGIVRIVDRAKDMVISAGENIYCAEVERVLGSHPEIGEVVMFGVPDARLGERAIVAVERRPGSTLDEDAVKAITAAQLADYKVPKDVLFDLGPFPHNAVGKVDKIALRSRYLERTRAAA